MPKSDESGFLDSVFPRVSPDDEGESPTDEETEKPDPREAYLPDVVGPRIRNALGGGQGIGGNPRRYGMIVALLVGLASLPSWIVLRSGIDEIVPGERMTGEAVLVQPLPELPLIVTAPRERTRTTTEVAEEMLARPAAPKPAQRPVVPKRDGFMLERGDRPAPPRPIFKHKHQKKIAKHRTGRTVIRQGHTRRMPYGQPRVASWRWQLAQQRAQQRAQHWALHRAQHRAQHRALQCAHMRAMKAQLRAARHSYIPRTIR